MADGRRDDGSSADRQRVHFGLKWTALSLVIFRFARLGTTIVLARLLTESMFGVVAMAMAFVIALQALREVGFGNAYIQRKDLSPKDDRVAASTVFWVALAINALMFAVGWALAPIAAGYFDKFDDLTAVLRGIFCLLLIEAFSSTPTAILQKRLEFGQIATGEMTGVCLHATLSITLAFLGFGAWSLVYGTLGSRLCQTLLVVHLSGWRPRFEFDGRTARELFSYGKYLWGTSLVMAGGRVVDKLVIGRVAGDVSLGVYSNSYNLCTTASKPITSIIQRVAFPAMARLQNDLQALRRAFLQAANSVMLLAVPIAVGLAATASDFVVTVYGPRWEPMAPIVRVLAFYGLVMSLAAVTTPVLMAIGRPRALFRFGVAGQVLMIALFFAFGHQGAIGIAWALLVAAVLSEGAAFLFAARSIGLGVLTALAPLCRSGAASIVMLAGVLGVQRALGPDAAAPLRLSLSVGFGVLVYAGATFFTNRESLTGALESVRQVVVAKGRLA